MLMLPGRPLVVLAWPVLALGSRALGGRGSLGLRKLPFLWGRGWAGEGSRPGRQDERQVPVGFSLAFDEGAH